VRDISHEGWGMLCIFIQIIHMKLTDLFMVVCNFLHIDFIAFVFSMLKIIRYLLSSLN